jgi:hypothetical protein
MKRLLDLRGGVLLCIVACVSFNSTAQTKDELTTKFAAFRASFVAKAAPIYGIPDDDPSSYIVISKAFVAEVVGKTANSAHLKVLYKRPKQNTHVDTIELKTPADSTDCNPDRWGCNSDCGWLDVGCHIAKAACEVWKGTNIGICNAQKAARDVYSDKIIADLNPGGVSTAGFVSAGPVQLALDPTLTQLSLTVPYSGKVWVAGQLYVTPKPLTFLTACFPHTITVENTEITSSSDSLLIPATVALEQAQDAIRVTAHFTTPSITLNFPENPIIMTLRNNPHSLLFCPVLESIGVVIGAISGGLTKTSYDIGVPSIPELSTRIEPLSVQFAGSQVSFVPSVTDKSVLFTVKIASEH